jgi:uncharacterized protein
MILTGAVLIGAGILAVPEPGRILAYFTTPAELYQGRAFVTGQRDETRIPGFERALADVVRKLTGDFWIETSEVMKAISAPVQDYVASYSETDRMADIPIHDEQGTRDRPFDLLVTFKPVKVDDLVKRLGRKPWKAARRETLVMLTVTTDAGSYVLTDDADQGIDQRESLKSAAWTAGIPIVLLTQEHLEAAPGTKRDFSKFNSAGQTLVGNLTWARGMKGWQGNWKLRTPRGSSQWRIEGVNFDDAFRNAMSGTASILSGHGTMADRAS